MKLSNLFFYLMDKKMSLVSNSIFSNEINFWVTPKKRKYEEALFKKELLSLIKDFICYHQGEFIQYAFLTAEYHKEMKKAFLKSGKNREEIENCYNDLVDYLNKQFAYVSNQSFEKIRTYFKDRHNVLPRICTKANFNSNAPSNSNKKIIELFRDHSVGYISDCEIEQNTGFKEVRDTGLYYSCQDIPKAVKNHEYVNPRINISAAKVYAPSQKKFLRDLFKKNDDSTYDKVWVECWENMDQFGKTIAVSYRDCYKSTLIIPLTLRNNILDNRFLTKFRLPDIDRTIFGYLCFDHIEINYFEVVQDQLIGYVFADILSLYLLIRHMYITQSDTFSKVEEYLTCGGN